MMTTLTQPEALAFLAELRQKKPSRFTQQDMADYFGLTGRSARQTVGKWERGQEVPGRRHRRRFMGYLWDVLSLKQQPEQFAEHWSTLAQQWGWLPLSDEEWRELTPLPPRSQNENHRAPTAAARPIPAPPRPTQPPATPTFVGRAFELSVYRQSLATEGLAVIDGMAGVGKTALAAVLARSEADVDRLFWHTFHPQEGSHVLFWKLAGFLARHRQDYLWRTLHGTQGAGGQPPPPEVLVDYMVQTLPGNGFLLCLDDLQFVQEDPVLNQLLDRLRPLLSSNSLRLLLTTRQAPRFVSLATHHPLTGLSDVDTYHFAAAHGLRLDDESLHALYTQTGGNAQFLTLALDALRTGTDPEHFLARLSTSDDVERYLLEAVDEHLNDDERAVMGAVATLLGYPGGRDAIEAILDREGVVRVIRSLRMRHLLAEGFDGESGEPVYSQHAVVQRFYYGLMGRRTRLSRHRRAGAYYQEVESDPLAAARHYLAGESQPEAAELLTDNVWALINGGQAQTLLLLLAQIEAQQLEEQRWSDVQVALGQVYALIGENQLAKRAYHHALEYLPTSDLARDKIHQARIYRLMGEVLQYESPENALEWLQRGITLVQDSGSEEEAALHIRTGAIQTLALGQQKAALAPLDRGLTLLPPGSSPLRGMALAYLGIAHTDLGNVASGIDYYRQALAIFEDHNDYWRMISMWNNMAIELIIAGEWDDAEADLHRALEMAEHLGSQRYKVELGLSLGILYTRRGQADAAETQLQRCIDLARQHDMNLHLANSLSSLADLYLRSEKVEAATPLIAESCELAQRHGFQAHLAEVHRLRAQVHLAKGNAPVAVTEAECSVQLARKHALQREEGMSLRVLGQALGAQGSMDAAVEAFERSVALLEECDLYEAGRAKLEWGIYQPIRKMETISFT